MVSPELSKVSPELKGVELKGVEIFIKFCINLKILKLNIKD